MNPRRKKFFGVALSVFSVLERCLYFVFGAALTVVVVRLNLRYIPDENRHVVEAWVFSVISIVIFTGIFLSTNFLKEDKRIKNNSQRALMVLFIFLQTLCSLPVLVIMIASLFQ